MDQPKNPSTTRSSAWQDDGLDFEVIDVEEARQILDRESLSPFGVSTGSPQEHWKRLRRGTLPTDRALTGRAIDWFLALPSSVRPQNLSLQFPRITNALADVWHEPQQGVAALDRLLCDGRQGRKGFPAVVRDELIALRNWKQTL